MFTGLIQEKGRISRMVKHQHNIKLTCKASRKLLADYKIGDSMAINGVCLTCVAKAGDMFTVDIMQKPLDEQCSQLVVLVIWLI